MERTDFILKNIHRKWQTLAIRQKISAFLGTALLIVVMACFLDSWILKLSLVDFYQILENNSRISELVQTLEDETAAFETYVRQSTKENEEQLKQTINTTYHIVNNLPKDYSRQGDRLFCKTWSIQNSYKVYQEKRDFLLSLSVNDPDYISHLYELYDMQSYLLEYARTLMSEELKTGNIAYHTNYPKLVGTSFFIIIVILILFSFMITLGRKMNDSIISPVVKLADASRKIAANKFQVEDIQTDNQDEIGELVAAFNKMKFATGQYIQTLEEKRIALDKLHEKEVERLEMEKRLETTKMELLQSQINPHFLFNTLNVISGMANLENAEITEKMIKSLSDLFRYTLKNDQAEVLLSKELKVLNDYFYLQHMRFGARISYQISCLVDANKIEVPAFILQPLAENAIIHGLSPKITGGKIRIRIRELNHQLILLVGDNGVGMTEETLAQLNNQMYQKNVKDLGIGFANVYKRIKSMYPQSSMQVFSKKNCGTVIKIQIPLTQKKGKGTNNEHLNS